LQLLHYFAILLFDVYVFNLGVVILVIIYFGTFEFFGFTAHSKVNLD